MSWDSMPNQQAYSLEITPEAKDDLRKIDKPQAERIVKKLRWLARMPNRSIMML
jgi:mRNA-degrading endonuclease RelE of RelBE toxin-antitoxin system